jgi:hypothetical protein
LENSEFRWAFVAVWDDDQHLDIVGWEFEGELPGTGIELRSEGGSFHDRESGQRQTEFIVGAEYGFVNSLVVTGKYRYINAPQNDGSGFVSPVVGYSLSAEMSLSGGVFVYHGAENSMYGDNPDTIVYTLVYPFLVICWENEYNSV